MKKIRSVVRRVPRAEVLLSLAEQGLINVDVLRRLIREELRAALSEESKPDEKKDGDEELTVAQLAEMKGVRPRTVYDWVREKRIPHHYTPGGRLRFYHRHAERAVTESPRPSWPSGGRKGETDALP